MSPITLFPPSSSSSCPTKPSTQPSPSPILPRLHRHFSTPISPTYSSLPLLFCCLISGLVDSVAYNAWSCFVSMQTGNTIILALGASQQPLNAQYVWLKGLVSIAWFVVGCFAFGRGIRAAGGKSRGALMGAFAVQAGMMLVAAGLVQGKVVPVSDGRVAPGDREPGNPYFAELVPLAILAFQAGGQIVVSRVLGFNEVPTTVLTSVYCDIASDEKLFKTHNEKRDRRILGVLMLLLGGIVGGWISRSGAGMATVLWIGAALKAGIAVAWAIWKGEKEIGR